MVGKESQRVRRKGWERFRKRQERIRRQPFQVRQVGAHVESKETNAFEVDEDEPLFRRMDASRGKPQYSYWNRIMRSSNRVSEDSGRRLPGVKDTRQSKELQASAGQVEFLSRPSWIQKISSELLSVDFAAEQDHACEMNRSV